MRRFLAALTGAVAVSGLLAAGQAAASPAGPAVRPLAVSAVVAGGRPHPVPVARRPVVRDAAGRVPTGAAERHRKPIRVGTITIPPCAVSVRV